MRTIFLSLVAGLALILTSATANAQDATFVKTSYNVLSDGNVELVFDVQINEGWYLYSATPVKGGPMTANFDMDAQTPAQAQGAMVDGVEPHRAWLCAEAARQGPRRRGDDLFWRGVCPLGQGQEYFKWFH